MSGLLLDPLQTCVKMTYPLLKHRWILFLQLSTQNLPENVKNYYWSCNEHHICICTSLKQFKCPMFAYGHHVYLPWNVTEECCSSQTQARSMHNSLLHDMAWHGYILCLLNLVSMGLMVHISMLLMHKGCVYLEPTNCIGNSQKGVWSVLQCKGVLWCNVVLFKILRVVS